MFDGNDALTTLGVCRDFWRGIRGTILVCFYADNLRCRFLSKTVFAGLLKILFDSVCKRWCKKVLEVVSDGCEHALYWLGTKLWFFAELLLDDFFGARYCRRRMNSIVGVFVEAQTPSHTPHTRSQPSRCSSISLRIRSETVIPNSLARCLSHFICGSVNVIVCLMLMRQSSPHYHAAVKSFI